MTIPCAKAQLLIDGVPLNPQPRMGSGHLLLAIRDVPEAKYSEVVRSEERQALAGSSEDGPQIAVEPEEQEKALKWESDRLAAKQVYEKESSRRGGIGSSLLRPRSLNLLNVCCGKT